MANIIWGYAKLDHVPRGAFLPAFCDCALHLLPHFGSQNASNLAWALAKMAPAFVPEAHLLDAIAAFAVDHMREFTPQARFELGD